MAILLFSWDYQLAAGFVSRKEYSLFYSTGLTAFWNIASFVYWFIVVNYYFEMFMYSTLPNPGNLRVSTEL